VDVDEIMCSYDFAWHPDVKDGKMFALHCVLNDVVLYVYIYIHICARVFVCGCVCMHVCQSVCVFACVCM
jgi:hypothetical protein